MKHSPLLSGIAVVALLSACAPAVPPEDQGFAASSSSAQPRMAMAEGTIKKAGIGIYMQGSHALVTESNEELLLTSASVRLDDYLDERVRVTGEVTPTVEAGGMIMNVESVERMTLEDLPEVLEEDSASSAASSLVSSLPSPASSSMASVRSSVAPPRSSVPARVVASSAAAQASSSLPPVSIDANASVTAMAKATVDGANFNQTYCSSHIGFCIPYHRNWYFQSFGANVAPNLWHVEIADHSVDEAGLGVIMVNLVSGTFEGSEGIAVDQGDFVVASRQWTGGRHVEVSGPKELKSAVEFMANGIQVQSGE